MSSPVNSMMHVLMSGLDQNATDSLTLEDLTRPEGWRNPFVRSSSQARGSILQRAFLQLDALLTSKQRATVRAKLKGELANRNALLKHQASASEDTGRVFIEPVNILELEKEVTGSEQEVLRAEIDGRPVFFKCFYGKGWEKIFYLFDPFHPDPSQRITRFDYPKNGPGKDSPRIVVENGTVYAVYPLHEIAFNLNRRAQVHGEITNLIERARTEGELEVKNVGSRWIGYDLSQHGKIIFHDYCAGKDFPLIDLEKLNLQLYHRPLVYMYKGKLRATLEAEEPGVDVFTCTFDLETGALLKKIPDASLPREMQKFEWRDILERNGEPWLYFDVGTKVINSKMAMINLQTGETRFVDFKPDHLTHNMTPIVFQGKTYLVRPDGNEILLLDIEDQMALHLPNGEIASSTEVIPFTYENDVYEFINSEYGRPSIKRLTEKP